MTVISNPDCVVLVKDRLAPYADEDLVPASVWKPAFGNPNDMAVWRWERNPKVGFPRSIKIANLNFKRVGDLREFRKRALAGELGTLPSVTPQNKSKKRQKNGGLIRDFPRSIGSETFNQKSEAENAMALKKDARPSIRTVPGEFTYRPGTICPHSGIYICINCRDEAACNAGDPLPPQNHRQHPDTTKPILWKLLVCTQTGPQRA
jgi:hypothetical protein